MDGHVSFDSEVRVIIQIGCQARSIFLEVMNRIAFVAIIEIIVSNKETTQGVEG